MGTIYLDTRDGDGPLNRAHMLQLATKIEELGIPFIVGGDFQNDPEAQVDGCNSPIPAGSIANRLDLTLPGSVCEFEDLDQMIGHKGYGALDMKFVTRRLLADGQQFWAVAGPMHNDKVAPFSWTSTNLTQSPYYTPILTFDFHACIHYCFAFFK